MEGAVPAPIRATIKQYPNNNPVNPQILEILIQTKKRGNIFNCSPWTL